MARMGRPRKEIDRIEFEKLCEMQCTEIEICGFFGICEDTLNSWCKRTYKRTFSETYKVYSQDGKVSLRRMQFNLAKTSAAMAIFLGKNMLGQSDEPNMAASAEAIARSNEQMVAIAELINRPVQDRTLEEVEAEGGTDG